MIALLLYRALAGAATALEAYLLATRLVLPLLHAAQAPLLAVLGR